MTTTLSTSSASAILRGNALAIVVVLVLAIPAATPFLDSGLLPTHDGVNHLFRLMAVDSALHSGVLYPRWFPDFAFGYGFHVLNFYSPAIYYLAELFHLAGAGYVLSIELMVFSTLALSGLFMFLWMADLFGRTPAVMAAVAYMYFPYHLVDVFVRGAYPELAAFALFPAILWCFHRAFTVPRPWPWFAGASLATALLILTHNLSTLMFAPVLGGYIVLIVCLPRPPIKWRAFAHVQPKLPLPSFSTAVEASTGSPISPPTAGQIVRRLFLAALSLALAAGLSAFYWLPVMTELKWVEIGREISDISGAAKHLFSLGEYISPFSIYRYFPNQGTVTEHPFGQVQVIVLLISLASLTLIYRRSRLAFLYLAFFVGVAGIAVFMLLPVSLPIWRSVPALSMLQYPWRLQAILAISTSVLASGLLYAVAGLVHTDPLSRIPFAGASFPALIVAVPLGAVLILSSIGDFPRQGVRITENDATVENMWRNDAQNNQIGATWSAEFLPLDVKEERWRIPRSAPPGPAPVASPLSPPGVRLTRSDGWSWSLTLDSPEALRLVGHAFYFPAWRASVDGTATGVYPVGSLGLVGFDVPAGKHEVTVELASTPVEDLATFVSLATAVVFVVLWPRGTLCVLRGLASWRLRLPQHQDTRPLSSSESPGRSFFGGGIRAIGLALAVLAAIGVLAAAHFFPRPATTLVPLDANLQNAAKLIGVETDRSSYRPGDTARLKLYWLGWSTEGKDYKAFIHLVAGPGEPPLAQHDGDPGGGFTPTSRWATGELVVDEHEVAIPAGLRPGSYRFEAGLYDPASLRNLSILGEDGRPVAERALLREVTISGP